MKKAMKEMIVLGAFVIIASSMMTGCGNTKTEKSKEVKKEKTIADKWEQVDGSQTIEFFKEGTVTVLDKGEPPLTGDYRFIDDNRIRMDLKGLGELMGPVIAKVSTSGDEITLTNPTGKIEIYRKLGESKREKEKVSGEHKGEERRLSIKEIRLLGEYIGQSEEVSQLFLELKGDGTCLLGPSTGLWEVKWVSKNDPPYAPYIGLQLYSSDSDNVLLSLYAGDNERPTKITRGFARIDFWHSLCPDWKYRTLRRQEEAKPIKLDKVRDFIEETTYPGEVEVWSKYIGDSQILELKRIPNFAPPGWKRIRSAEGSYILYKTFEWKIISGNRIQLCADEDLIEFEIKDKTSADEKEGIIFVKQNSRSLFLVLVALPAEPRSKSQREETSGLESIDPSEVLWVKCKNPNCGAEYQMSKKECFKYIEEHANPIASSALALICEKCGEQSIYRAEKCGNPDCGLVFFRGTVPNDFPDRCPKCGYSVTEEQRKSRMSNISSSPVSSPSETTDLDPAWRSRRARHR